MEKLCHSRKKKSDAEQKGKFRTLLLALISQQETNLIEIENGEISAFEKWNPGKKAKIPLAFREGYAAAKSAIINPDTYLQAMLTH